MVRRPGAPPLPRLQRQSGPNRPLAASLIHFLLFFPNTICFFSLFFFHHYHIRFVWFYIIINILKRCSIRLLTYWLLMEVSISLDGWWHVTLCNFLPVFRNEVFNLIFIHFFLEARLVWLTSRFIRDILLIINQLRAPFDSYLSCILFAGCWISLNQSIICIRVELLDYFFFWAKQIVVKAVDGSIARSWIINVHYWINDVFIHRFFWNSIWKLELLTSWERHFLSFFLPFFLYFKSVPRYIFRLNWWFMACWLSSLFIIHWSNCVAICYHMSYLLWIRFDYCLFCLIFSSS